MSDPRGDLATIYASALERLDAIRDTWFALGQPLTATGSMGQAVESPLVKLLRETEMEVARLGVMLDRKRGPGRNPVAVLEGTVGASPAAKVKRIDQARRAKPTG